LEKRGRISVIGGLVGGVGGVGVGWGCSDGGVGGGGWGVGGGGVRSSRSTLISKIVFAVFPYGVVVWKKTAILFWKIDVCSP